ncbi:MAG: alpha/beta hydrolase, partial [Burkholderiaceae bacterium]|nr:alpha/beta hydrolase [Burkholderiaceae bacterium]
RRGRGAPAARRAGARAGRAFQLADPQHARRWCRHGRPGARRGGCRRRPRARRARQRAVPDRARALRHQPQGRRRAGRAGCALQRRARHAGLRGRARHDPEVAQGRRARGAVDPAPGVPARPDEARRADDRRVTVARHLARRDRQARHGAGQCRHPRLHPRLQRRLAARRAGQLSHDLGFAGPTVLFSWPSQGGLTDYTVDEQSAEWSIPDMRDVLASLATVAPGTPVYVIAHSMGNRVLTRGFKALIEQDARKLAAFRQIVLAAPDIDADVFRRELGPAILGKGPRVTLYASSNDKALVASRKVHGGYKRLGESGDGIVVMNGLDTVDASNVSTEFLGHSYFGDSSTVMSDLIYVIQKSLPPQERTRFALEPVRAAIGQYWRFKSH